MNFFGIGTSEFAMILLIGVLVLGPVKIVDAGRTLGKYWGQTQKILRETADAATIKLDSSYDNKNQQTETPEVPNPIDSVSITSESALFEEEATPPPKTERGGKGDD
jgi:Sec-independent protein translocase protein TatA